MTLRVFGINHMTADLQLREALSFQAEQLPAVLSELSSLLPLNEVAVLSTCNRTEIYCISNELETGQMLNFLCQRQGIEPPQLTEALYEKTGDDALRHMISVASGLDSMVLGEPQVLGQMKSAYAEAHRMGYVGRELEKVFQQTFAATKHIRNETHIGANPVSVAYAAVSMAKRIFAHLEDVEVLLIGAGEMIELVAAHLSEKGVKKIVVANRTLERAHAISDRFPQARAINLDEIPLALQSAGMVVACTAATLPILGKGTIERALKSRRRAPVLMVDLAVPRDIEPEVGEMDDVYLYTIDDLHDTVEENLKARQRAAEKANSLIEIKIREYRDEMKSLDAVSTIKAYREKVESIREQEFEKAVQELQNGADAGEVLNRMSRAIVNKVLHEPSIKIKQATIEDREEVVEWAKELLGITDTPD